MNFRTPVLRIIIFIIIIIPTNFLSIHVLNAEERPKKNASDTFFTEAAFITGLGSGSIPEGDYQPVLLIGHFGIDLKKYIPGLKNHRGTLSAFIEPQFNTVVNPKTDFECGIGIGIKYMYSLTEKVSFYILGSVGPHYVSVITTEQANGFIFSDVVGGGVYIHLGGKSALIMGYRFRHISNANLTKPNGGIDTHFGIIGYSMFFE